MFPRFHASALRQIAAGYFEGHSAGRRSDRRSPELADDLAIVGILLTLESASRLVDMPEALCYLLTLSLGHSKHSIGRRQFPTIQPPSRITVPMSFPAGLGHG